MTIFFLTDALNKMLVPGEPSKPTLKLWVRPGAYSRVEHLFRASATKESLLLPPGGKASRGR